MKYLSYLPEIFQEIKDYVYLGEAFDQEISRLLSTEERMIENYFVFTAKEQGCSRWERLLELPSEGSLEQRRKAIQTKLVTRVPINLKVIRGVAKNYLGLPVTAEVKGNQLRIGYRGNSRTEEFSSLYRTLYELIPASLLCEIYYQYLTWEELDRQSLHFTELEEKNLSFTEFERGIWLEDGR